MAAVLVQSRTQPLTGTGGTFAFLANVTSGNTVIVAVAQGAGSTATISDATNGTYTQAISRILGGRVALVHYKHNVTGGFTNITVTMSQSFGGRVFLYEVSGLDSGAAVLTGGVDTASGTSHTCSGSTLTAVGFGVTANQPNTNSANTPGGSWQTIFPDNDFQWGMYNVGSVNDNGPYTSSGTINSTNVMALFPESVVAAGLPFITQLDCRRI